MGFSYLEFENSFRGSYETVKNDMEEYLPFFRGREPILDIGSGRGEFLELLRENGIKDAYGIDNNEEMVNYSREKKAKVQKADALSHLAQLEDSSIGGVFLSHVAEHFKPADLMELLALTARKISPGGVFVAETLNPQCIFSHAPYHMDGTHLFFIHPLTFKFLLEAYGFKNIDFMYRQYLPDEFLRLNDIPEEEREKTALEEAYLQTVRKLQVIIDQTCRDFIYSIIAYQ